MLLIDVSISPQIYKSLPSIPSDLSSAIVRIISLITIIIPIITRAVVWVFSILPLISNSFSLFSKTVGTVPSAPTITGILVTKRFHRFF